MVATNREAGARSDTPGGLTALWLDVIEQVTDTPTPEHLEQLARSVAMSGALGDRDRLEVVAAPRRLAGIDEAARRNPANRRPS
jgi:hypothetical protein